VGLFKKKKKYEEFYWRKKYSYKELCCVTDKQTGKIIKCYPKTYSKKRWVKGLWEID
jgi:hypothetical protein